MRASFQYDSSYDPAAPVMRIGLSKSGEENAGMEIVALVDTGSDATMIPLETLKMINARYIRRHRMRGILGVSLIVHQYILAVHVAGIVIHGIRAVASPGDQETVIGRDVLNQLEILLNGPAHELWVS